MSLRFTVPTTAIGDALFDDMPPEVREVMKLGFSRLATLPSEALSLVARHLVRGLDPSEPAPESGDFARESQIDAATGNAVMAAAALLASASFAGARPADTAAGDCRGYGMDKPSCETNTCSSRESSMRFTRRKYSVVTNTCLILGVLSAFGFDYNDHPVWLVLGGCAGILAIATYFVQHWERRSAAESIDVSSANSLVTEMQPPVASVWFLSDSGSPQDAYRERGGSRRYKFSHSDSRYTVSKSPDLAEWTSGIVRRFHLGDRPRENTFEIIVSDDSITVRVKGNDERPRVGNLLESHTTPVGETIH